jgi:hypothetical protein
MSFLDSGNSRYTWIAASTRSRALLPPDPGCVQCGRLLEVEHNKSNFTGRCYNCATFVSDGEEEFEDFEE